MIRIFKRLPGVIFMVLLLGLAGKEALSHQRTYSPVEKRELQTRPEISITKVLDGRFQRKYESYLRDQFPGRDHWVSFQTDMELFMGKNEIHNVYIGKNNYLLEHYTEKEFDPQQISKNLQAGEVCRKSKTERGCPCDDGADKVVGTPGKTSGICPAL